MILPDHSIVTYLEEKEAVRDFGAVDTMNPGEVRLQQKAVKRISNYFKMSTDIANPANWCTIELTALADCETWSTY